MSESEASTSSPFYSISTYTQVLVDDSIYRLHQALQRIRAGQYGPSDYFRDCATTWFTVCQYYFSVVEVLITTSDLIVIPAAPSDSKAIGIRAVGEISHIDTHDGALCLKDDSTKQIKYSAERTSDRTSFVVTVDFAQDQCPPLASGQLYVGKVTVDGLKYEIRLEIA